MDLTTSFGCAFELAQSLVPRDIPNPEKGSSVGETQKKSEPMVISLTSNIAKTYQRCNPSFRAVSKLPGRLLTNPGEGVRNDGADNRDHNLICRVHDGLFSSVSNSTYTILDSLGLGTFGQVFRCQKNGTKEIVAVKVIKNKTAYHNQGMIEIKVLRQLNKTYDPKNQRHIVRMMESFEHKGHICIVFELLNMSLLDVLTQNQLRGLPLAVVQRFTRQILSALVTLQDADVVHCDLKPENILLVPQPVTQKQRRVSKKVVTPDKVNPAIPEGSTRDAVTLISPPLPELSLGPSATAATESALEGQSAVTGSGGAADAAATSGPTSSDGEEAIVTVPTTTEQNGKATDGNVSSPTADTNSSGEHSSGATERLGVLSDIKVIDFGSACFEGRTMYSYIQSRFCKFYRLYLGNIK